VKNAAIRTEWLVAGIFLLVGIVFAACTQHVWEDYWITFRASRNLATGNGLVFTPGERLHTFTSPIGTLLPAGLSWLTGNHSDALVLWLFRFISLAALAGGLILFLRMMQSLQFRRVSIWLTLALIGLDGKIVDFCINGMETGLLILFLALTIHGLVVAGPRQMWRIGGGWAGLMWTRPDSFIYIAILGAGTLLFLSGRKFGKSPVAWVKLFFVAGLICAALYVWWFAWAWSYYGSPVPHTIIAKATNKPPLLLVDLVTALFTYPFSISSLQVIFLPAYSDHGGWPQFLVVANSALGLIATYAWLVPGLRPQTKVFSLAFFLGNFYLTAILKYFPPWYLPTVEVFGYLTIGFFFDQLLCLLLNLPQPRWADGRPGILPKLLRKAAVAVIIGQAALTVCVARQLQVQQRLIEDGLRRPIGLWLRDHARTPHDTVMLEPLGYIGYYSGLKMFDYPGLASQEMVDARKRLGPFRENLVYLQLKPDWLVLRPNESRHGFYVEVNGLRKDYDLVKIFDATDKINAVRWLPGKPYLQYDQTFEVYHRKADAPF
jgi:hypothetical protein